jgi:hypothetical protein
MLAIYISNHGQKYKHIIHKYSKKVITNVNIIYICMYIITKKDMNEQQFNKTNLCIYLRLLRHKITRKLKTNIIMNY